MHLLSHSSFLSLSLFRSLRIFPNRRFAYFCLASAILCGMFAGIVGAEPVGTDEYRTGDSRKNDRRPWAAHAEKFPACANIISSSQKKTDEIMALDILVRRAVRPAQQELLNKLNALGAERIKIDNEVRACIQKEATKPREKGENKKGPPLVGKIEKIQNIPQEETTSDQTPTSKQSSPDQQDKTDMSKSGTGLFQLKAEKTGELPNLKADEPKLDPRTPNLKADVPKLDPRTPTLKADVPQLDPRTPSGDKKLFNLKVEKSDQPPAAEKKVKAKIVGKAPLKELKATAGKLPSKLNPQTDESQQLEPEANVIGTLVIPERWKFFDPLSDGISDGIMEEAKGIGKSTERYKQALKDFIKGDFEKMEEDLGMKNQKDRLLKRIWNEHAKRWEELSKGAPPRAEQPFARYAYGKKWGRNSLPL